MANQDDSLSHYDRMVAGDPYIADDPRIAEDNLRAIRLQNTYADTYDTDSTKAHEILVDLLGEIANDAAIRPPLFVDYGRNISVGARTFINYNLTALDTARIEIGEDCQIGPHVQLLTPTHPVDPEQRRAKWEAAAPITIGDNVWLGGGVIVLPGVTIGSDSVIGAGSVVTNDVPEGVVAVGNPARVIGKVANR